MKIAPPYALHRAGRANVGPPGGRNSQGRLRALHIGGLTADQRQNDSKGDRADHGCFSARVSIVTCTDIPGRRRSLLFCPSLTVIRTGMRWAILTKLPAALSGEMALNSTPAAGEILCTLPWKVSPLSASTVKVTYWPTRTSASWVSLRLAITQCCGGTSEVRWGPALT